MIKEDKGQFYIVIAVIIIAILGASFAIFNYARTSKKPVKFYDLSEELGTESKEVISHGIYQNKHTDKLIENFTDTYADYFELMAGKSELFFIYGNEDNLTMISYSNITQGRIGLYVGESKSYLDITGKEKRKTSLIPFIQNITGNYVVVNIDEKIYNFTLHKGENFFFVLSKNLGNETYITGR